jgi:hypothetical protein
LFLEIFFENFTYIPYNQYNTFFMNRL